MLSTLLSISVLAAVQELTIEEAIISPREVALFNGVSISIDKESISEFETGDTVVVPDFPLGTDSKVQLRLQQFDVFSTHAEVVLGSVNYLGDTVHRQTSKPEVILLKGTIEGDPSSKVFISLGDHTTNGLIETEGRTYVLAKNKTAGWTAVYNLNDIESEDMHWADFYCDVIDTGNGAASKHRNLPFVGGGCQALKIAIDTDWEFVELFDGSVDAASEYAVTLIGAMSTIFETDLDVSTQISYLRIWNDSSDPWDSSTPSSQLNQFRTYWEENMGSVDRHLSHLLSGRSLGGGIAWLNGVCTSYGYAVSGNLAGTFPLPLQDNHFNNWDIYVVAHETGHNCGSPHTHDYIPEIDSCGDFDLDDEDRCEGADSGTIMSYCHLCPGGMSNIVLSFHQEVQVQINNYLSNGITCSLDCEEIELLGACCDGQMCTELTESMCSDSGGTYWGDGTICLNNICVPQHGACCLDGTGLCVDDIGLSSCNSQGGIYLGNGTSCDLGWCNPAIPTACCIDNECSDLLEEECEEAGGSRLGLGIFCSEDVCIIVDNDTCETAREVTSGLWSFTTDGASTGGPDTDETQCETEFLGGVNYDVWFTYDACESNSIEIGTCSSADFDTDLVVYSYDGLDCNTMTQLDCNGDSAGCDGFTSSVSLNVAEGQSYLIRVGGFHSSAQGNGQLLITGQVCQPDIPCSGDVTGDGVVGVNDILGVISHWMSTDGNDVIQYDVDESGVIEIGDILFILAHWGCETTDL